MKVTKIETLFESELWYKSKIAFWKAVSKAELVSAASPTPTYIIFQSQDTAPWFTPYII